MTRPFSVVPAPVAAAALLGLTLSGCGGGLYGGENGQVAPLTSPILVQAHENLLPAGRTLDLQCATQEIYGCSNYALPFFERTVSSGAFVEFRGVMKWSTCATSLGPARCTVPLGTTQLGAHPLYLRANGGLTGAALLVSPESIAVLGGEGPSVRFARQVVQRVPPGAIWGYLDWRSLEPPGRAQQFLDSLQALGARPLRLPAGDYDYFRVDPSGAIFRTDGYAYRRTFAFALPGHRDAVSGLVRSFGDSVMISVYGDRGEAWFSWVLRGS